MKAFTTVFLALFALATSVKAGAVEPADVASAAVSPAPVIETALTGPGSADQPDASSCFWSGTSPFCAGSCPTGSTAAWRVLAGARRWVWEAPPEEVCIVASRMKF
ncbi:hypothetical protein ONZ51_g6818 [Trametes cubensis]|uniref:Uncharacterized protein n=1 Tax=Trametes cubensis TaxID=1111947 RepID=A0AAD7TRU7_9APHY|nr:hypothetical protein ONZ51_g6818 [Trametes cubensis]